MVKCGFDSRSGNVPRDIGEKCWLIEVGTLSGCRKDGPSVADGNQPPPHPAKGWTGKSYRPVDENTCRKFCSYPKRNNKLLAAREDGHMAKWRNW